MDKREPLGHPGIGTESVKRRSGRSRLNRSVRLAGSTLLYLGVTAIACTGLYGLALVSAETFLVERDEPIDADIIVVLGGDGPPRVEQAAALWHHGKAAFILATGYNECEYLRQALVAAGVETRAIVTECHSKTTWDNATLSQPILDDLRVNRAILVTSWYHSKRAVKRFRSVIPSIQWVSVPAETTKPYWVLALDVDGPQIFKEYVKSIAYDLRTSLFGVGAALPRKAAAKTSRLP